MKLSRKDLLRGALTTAAAGLLPLESLAQAANQSPDALSLDDLKAMQKVAGLAFTDEELRGILNSVRQTREGFRVARTQVPDGAAEPPTVFRPIGGGSEPNARVSVRSSPARLSRRGLSEDDIAFLSVRELGHLLRTRQITSVELTELYLRRLKTYGDPLLCVVTLTEERAVRQAREADREMAAGKVRGPLHGIPYGIKDLFFTKGYPTGFGAEPYDGRRVEIDATVVERLDAAGAILVAKLSLGALAMNDHWTRGRTKNPWNPTEGSSGSSAGSAAATAAGLVAFAIGTETQGSITSPSMRCRVTGLRPTYGRVSRYGGMELSYTMDKVGPICREVEDCALVLAAICGVDPKDPSSVDRSFNYRPRVDWKSLKIGVLVGDSSAVFDTKMANDPVLKFLAGKGATLAPLRLTPLPEACFVVIDVESASAFDEITRDGRVNTIKNSLWPSIFREGRFVPAVEYLQAMRLRRIAMERAERELADFDLFVSDGIGEYTVPLVNQCGYPQVIIPQGTRTVGSTVVPVAKSFTGRLYDEETILAVAREVQQAGNFHRLRPDLGKV